MNLGIMRRRDVMIGDNDKLTLLWVKNVLVPNTYINKGVETKYSGWTSTDYIDISGYKHLASFDNIFREFVNVYNAFYDENKTIISYNVRTGIIPSNAKYFRTSQNNQTMSRCYLLLCKEEFHLEDAELFDSNKYVNNGIITNYSGWNLFKAIPSTAHIFSGTNIYQASYDINDSLFDHTKNMLSIPQEGYVLLSNNSNSAKYISVDNYKYIEI